MKQCIAPWFLMFSVLILSVSAYSCRQQAAETTVGDGPTTQAVQKSTRPEKRALSQEFKDYWYDGKAELTSYKLEQARYGELRDGHAVLIYVTEPFLADKQVKADTNNPENIPVLKLNLSKKFVTGIYPYSIMTSIFEPIYEIQHAIKVSNSVQEWCGNAYTQLNNRENFEVVSHSYFEKEADRQFSLKKDYLEDEVWTQIRINPSTLPQGTIKMIPSLEYARLRHKEIKAYEALASLSESDTITTYEVTYPELERTLRIRFQTMFPYSIEGWTETAKSGFGAGARTLSTQAAKMHVLKTAYWQKNGNKDVILRDSLGL